MADSRCSLVTNLVSEYFNISVEKIKKGIGCNQEETLYRQIAIYMCSKLNEIHSNIVMAHFNLRDETVLQYSISKIDVLKEVGSVEGLSTCLEELGTLFSQLERTRTVE